MIVLFLVLNFVLMIVIPGFFDAQSAFAKLWPVLLLDRPGSRAPRPKLPRAKQPEFAKPAGLGFFCTDPETPDLNSEAATFSPTSGLRPVCPFLNPVSANQLGSSTPRLLHPGSSAAKLKPKSLTNPKPQGRNSKLRARNLEPHIRTLRQACPKL